MRLLHRNTGVALYLSKVESEREALSETSDTRTNDDVIDDSIIEVEDITDNAKVSPPGYKLVALVQDENSSKHLRVSRLLKRYQSFIGLRDSGVVCEMS